MSVVKKFLQSLRCIVASVFTVSNPANVVMVEDDKLRMKRLILTRGNELGTGTYGIVTMVRDMKTRQYYAMKVSILNPNVHDREIELLVCLKHPNIIRLFGFYFRDSKKNPSTIIQNMLLECMPGDLFSLFAEQRQRDVWAAGCVLAECFTCSPIFPGRKDHQLGAICAILGNPPVNVLRALQPNLRRIRLKRRQAVTLPTAMGIPKEHLAILLLEQILSYEPLKRLTAWQVCAHDFFEELLEGDGISMKFKFTQSEVKSMPDNVREKLLAKKQCSLEGGQHSVVEANKNEMLQLKRKKASTVVQLVRSQALRRAANNRSVREKTQTISDAGTTMTTMDKDYSPGVFEERRSRDLESFSSVLRMSRNELDQRLKSPQYEMETPSSAGSTEYVDKEEEDNEAELPKASGNKSSSQFMCILKTPFDGNTETSSDINKLRKEGTKAEEQLCCYCSDGPIVPMTGSCRAVVGQVAAESCLNISEKKSDRRK
ncbi:glycogen synthase kinase 3 beta [Trichuris trichiura]|uniref:Glycogen synthase kinase 3 beta n=1 Tax=Trichuris trichiura TaxID=36087 RepID=A0A077ZBR5_TRITR|nr:glycogen synthase kinase 3 beta [Trichuris trichiura]